jgi:hypothetical protein
MTPTMNISLIADDSSKPNTNDPLPEKDLWQWAVGWHTYFVKIHAQMIPRSYVTLFDIAAFVVCLLIAVIFAIAETAFEPYSVFDIVLTMALLVYVFITYLILMVEENVSVYKESFEGKHPRQFYRLRYSRWQILLWFFYSLAAVVISSLPMQDPAPVKRMGVAFRVFFAATTFVINYKQRMLYPKFLDALKAEAEAYATLKAQTLDSLKAEEGDNLSSELILHLTAKADASALLTIEEKSSRTNIWLYRTIQSYVDIGILVLFYTYTTFMADPSDDYAYVVFLCFVFLFNLVNSIEVTATINHRFLKDFMESDGNWVRDFRIKVFNYVVLHEMVLAAILAILNKLIELTRANVDLYDVPSSSTY